MPEPEARGEHHWYHNQDEKPPPAFKCGPLIGRKTEFAEVCLGRRVDHRTFEKACVGQDACFWVRKLTRLEGGHPYGVWFKTESDLQAAEQRLLNLRKPNTGSGTVEGKLADGSMEPTDN
jgi:hypothetical protein